MGLGEDQVYKVKTDKRGHMIPEELSKEIKRARDEGKDPYFVNATAGTTVFGAYDPIQEISKICQKEQLWLHIDVIIDHIQFFLI